MQKKIGEPVHITPIKNMTRKRKREPAVFSTDAMSPCDGYKSIDSSILQGVLNCFSKVQIVGLKKSWS